MNHKDSKTADYSTFIFQTLWSESPTFNLFFNDKNTKHTLHPHSAAICPKVKLVYSLNEIILDFISVDNFCRFIIAMI